jgi:hypothetical protein
MTNEHNNLAAKFRQDIEALEVVFINATKAAKYVPYETACITINLFLFFEFSRRKS